MKHKTEIISRFIYKHPISENRLWLLRNEFLPALNHQTDTDFLLRLFVHRDTYAFMTNVDYGDIRVAFTVFDDEFPKNNPEPGALFRIPQNMLPHIQIRLDCDDWVAPNFVSAIKGLWDYTTDTLITFHPDKRNTVTGETYRHQRAYSAKCPSMFLALCQKNPKIFVYELSHDIMPQLIHNVTYVDFRKKSMCRLNIHTENIFSKL